eukprot:CAMPEP_0170949346 /NCGR_PEP_ID=MMETSP0735-20130129/29223_1 /TAXON_ID=186038 /ORGANISM="Fragilariopsis kerguelensis, Strain L26-C5" /LENGTH=98 /DNA_ID=CAMNT_0011359397 /DNA_START=148 /DNA_END=441 /DNA_ORIENTATION=+
MVHRHTLYLYYDEPISSPISSASSPSRSTSTSERTSIDSLDSNSDVADIENAYCLDYCSRTSHFNLSSVLNTIVSKVEVCVCVSSGRTVYIDTNGIHN